MSKFLKSDVFFPKITKKTSKAKDITLKEIETNK